MSSSAENHSSLFRYEPSDIVHSDSWEELSSLLRGMLASPHPELAAAALGYLHKMFFARSEVAREVFALVAKHVGETVAELRLPLDRPLHPAGSPRVLALVHQAQALQDFQREFPRYWIRLGERSMDPLARATVRLLRQDACGRHVSAAHLLALSEPRAPWLHQWVRGQYARRQFLRHAPGMFSDSVLLTLRDIAWWVREGSRAARAGAVSSERASQARETPTSALAHGVYSPQQLRYLAMMHNLSVVAAIVGCVVPSFASSLSVGLAVYVRVFMRICMYVRVI